MAIIGKDDAREREREELEQVYTMINNPANLFPLRTRQIWRSKIDALVRAVREADKEAALNGYPLATVFQRGDDCRPYAAGRRDAAASIEALGRDDG